MATAVGGASATRSKDDLAAKRRSVVVCFNGPIRNGWPTAVFRTKPRRCTFTYRQAPHPIGAASDEVIHLRGRIWHHSRAHGRGGALINGAPHPAPTDVRLFRARNRCGGRRVFTKARFNIHYRRDPARFTMPLHICS